MAVAVDLFVKYLSPAGPGDTLEIVTHVDEMRGARTRWIQGDVLKATFGSGLGSVVVRFA